MGAALWFGSRPRPQGSMLGMRCAGAGNGAIFMRHASSVYAVEVDAGNVGRKALSTAIIPAAMPTGGAFPRPIQDIAPGVDEIARPLWAVIDGGDSIASAIAPCEPTARALSPRRLKSGGIGIGKGRTWRCRSWSLRMETHQAEASSGAGIEVSTSMTSRTSRHCETSGACNAASASAPSRNRENEDESTVDVEHHRVRTKLPRAGRIPRLGDGNMFELVPPNARAYKAPRRGGWRNCQNGPKR